MHLEAVLGSAEAARVVETMRAPKGRVFVHNKLRGEVLPELPRSPLGVADLYRYEGAAQALNQHPAAEDGLVYPINPSSVLPVLALGARPGEEVLDLAAAPGGKTVLLANAMGNSGRIAAVEAVRARFHRLRANLERCGVTNAQCYLDDGRNTGRKVGERFDRVLLDAPCASEARVRLDDPSTLAHWSPRKVKEASRKQRGLIRSAYAALKPGGVLVYCTCSFSVEENELVVAHLLAREPGASLAPLEAPAPRVRAGHTSWRGKNLPESLARTVRVLPDELWDGFYVAKIVKAASAT